MATTKGSGPPPPAELIERLQRRRTGLAFFQGIVFLMWQSAFLRIASSQLDVSRSVDRVGLASYLILAVLLMVFLARNGGFGWSPEVRRILNDEGTRENRRRGFEVGFWAAALAALGCLVTLLFTPVPAFAAVHVVLSAGLLGALATFAVLERRAQGG